MGIIYNYISKNVGAAEERVIDTSEISALTAATSHQITLDPVSATAGTVDIYVKYIGSNDFVGLIVNSVQQTIDLADPVAILDVHAAIHSYKLMPAGVNGTYNASFSGVKANAESVVSAENTLLIEDIREAIGSDATVNMGGSDYEMTTEEAISFVKLISNAGAPGDMLSWPEAAESRMAYEQAIANFSGQRISCELLSGGSSCDIDNGDVTELVFIPGVGVFNLATFYAAMASRTYSGVTDISDDYDMSLNDSGRLVVMDSATPKTISFQQADVEAMPANHKGWIRSKGAGAITIAGGGTVTIDGISTLAINDLVMWFREGTTNNIIVG